MKFQSIGLPPVIIHVHRMFPKNKKHIYGGFPTWGYPLCIIPADWGATHDELETPGGHWTGSPIPVPCTPIVWPRFGGKSSPYMEHLGTRKIDYTTIFLVKVTKKSQPLSDKNSTHRCALSFDIKTEDLSHARHVHG